MVSHTQYLTVDEQGAIQELADARAEVARLEGELTTARGRVDAARAKLAALAAQQVNVASETVQSYLSGTAMAYLQDAELSEEARAALNSAQSRGQGFGHRYSVTATRAILAEMLARLEETQMALRHSGSREHKNDIGNLQAVIKRLREKVNH